MSNTKELAIIIPCYNEANRLPQNDFITFIDNNKNIDIYFVNDGSTDNTQVIIEQLAHENESFHVLSLAKNQGKAAAVRQGFLYCQAQQNILYKYIAYFDADLATPLEEASKMLTLALNNDYSMIFGSRLARLGAQIHRNPSRHYLGRFFATAISNMLQLPVYDTQCGSKIIKSTHVNFLFKDKFISKWFFDVEIFFRFLKMDKKIVAKIYEYPLNIWIEKGDSRLNFTDFATAPIELLKIYLHYK